MRHFAVIPVKHVSERVDGKNFRPFLGGKSLLDLKIEQLLDSKAYQEIFVSSNSPLARASADKYGVRFVVRPDKFCDNTIRWNDVIVEVVSSLGIEADDVLSWCHVTSPLFRDFGGAVRRFEALPAEYNGLFTVARLNRYILNERYRPVNYAWDRHPYSQELVPHYFMTLALFMGRKRDLLDARYVITSRPYALETSEREAVDIDTELEFKMARWLFEESSDGP